MLGPEPLFQPDIRPVPDRLSHGAAGPTSLPQLLQWLQRHDARGKEVCVAPNHAATQILSLLTSSVYRKGSLQSMRFKQCYRSMLACVESCVKENKPVQLTLMAFPFKVPNPAKVGPRKLPELAELTAILRFQRLNARI